jgi:hypothetical protein
MEGVESSLEDRSTTRRRNRGPLERTVLLPLSRICEGESRFNSDCVEDLEFSAWSKQSVSLLADNTEWWLQEFQHTF